ncbi:MAG: excinuclease ABC subunit UvrC [Candidatus Thermoplasmatota archaeon]|nr:excinuclease ABC subunit UvrC [Candidatus Thermoplasmatota archaeon]
MFNLENIPKNPGCYLFKDKKDKIIYVGKAKNLKNRLKTYQNKKDLDVKTQVMLSHLKTIDFVVTDNEVESLILENTLIKKHQPRYNIRLKDAKSHTYLLLTNEECSRVLIDRGKTGKGKFYGPFVSAYERDYVLHFLRKTFLLRTCKKMPKKPCLRHHINLCDAPCTGLISKKDYENKIKKVKMVLSGKTQELIKNLEKEMKVFSKNNMFEQALSVREEINAVRNLSEHQKMQREKKYNEDIINYQIKDDKVYLMLFNIYKGTLSNKNEFIFEYNPDFFEEFIVQYYSDNPIVKELIIPQKISDSITHFLSDKKKSKVKITIPVKGEKKQLLELVLKNIDIVFFTDLDKVKILKARLHLQENPGVIECFDISHLSGTSMVGSMVQFRNGKPDKNNYRRFKIRTIKEIDDTGAIAEVARRRYTRLKNEDTEMPNLIIIDGGRGQLNYAIRELEKLNIKIPIISIAKQFEEIYIPGIMNTFRFSKKDKALQFIQEIRNEAHRFAIKYNRLLRKKEMVK